MPYVKRIEIPYAAVGRLLKGYGINAEKLAGILECSVPTARARLNDPQRFSLAELGKVSRKGHVPIEEIRDAITR